MRRAAPLASVALLAVLVVLATSIVDVGPVTRGSIVTAVVFGLIVALEAAVGGIGQRLLSLSPLPYLGRISYSTYLWHWIIILVATRQLSMAPLPTFAVAVLLATGLAALSYELLEHPIRVSPLLARHRMAVIATGLIMSVMVGVAIVPRLLDRASSTVPVAASSSGPLSGTPNHAELVGGVPRLAEGQSHRLRSDPRRALSRLSGYGHQGADRR